MKKIIGMCVAFLILNGITVFASEQQVSNLTRWCSVSVNDRSVNLRRIMKYQNEIYIPVREFCESLDCRVDWAEQTQSISITKTAPSHDNIQEIKAEQYQGIPGDARKQYGPFADGEIENTNCWFEFNGKTCQAASGTLTYQFTTFATVDFMADLLGYAVEVTSKKQIGGDIQQVNFYFPISFKTEMSGCNMQPEYTHYMSNNNTTVVFKDDIYLAFRDGLYHVNKKNMEKPQKINDEIVRYIQKYGDDLYYIKEIPIFVDEGGENYGHVSGIYKLPKGKAKSEEFIPATNGEMFIQGDWMYYTVKKALKDWPALHMKSMTKTEMQEMHKDDKIIRMNLKTGVKEELYTGPIAKMGLINENGDLYFEEMRNIKKLDLKTGIAEEVMPDARPTVNPNGWENIDDTDLDLNYAIFENKIIFGIQCHAEAFLYDMQTGKSTPFKMKGDDGNTYNLCGDFLIYDNNIFQVWPQELSFVGDDAEKSTAIGKLPFDGSNYQILDSYPEIAGERERHANLFFIDNNLYSWIWHHKIPIEADILPEPYDGYSYIKRIEY